ncbi:TIGR02217 family protein [Methylosinus sporium]|uniref:phage distal tail protein, Rcc01695 family n=1 Tax=Methylosinus sporium TaxID=428 RepID=UPI00383BB104
MVDFHETRFPLDVSLNGRGGPERRTDIVTLGSNREARNARWAQSRRRYEAGYGVKSLAQLAAVVEFFEERRGRLFGFRWRDRADFSSAHTGPISHLDQSLGAGDGAQAQFQLRKTYGGSFAPYARTIAKPVAESVRVGVAGVEKTRGVDFDVDATSGIVRFSLSAVPGAGAAVTAGFLFDVPARFDTDYLEIDVSSFEAGAIPKIPIIELIL